jgi:hypothetical protein
MWARDFPIMKSMGVNTLRMYNTNPITMQYSQDVLAGKLPNPTNIKLPNGKSHVEFMDLAYHYGFMVLFPLIGDENIIRNTPQAQYYQLLRNQIDEVGNHPALLMFSVGNELNLADNTLMTAVINAIEYSRNYTLAKWGRSIPFTHAVVDNPPSYDHLITTLPVDVFSSNAGYRGEGFQDLFSGNKGQNFSGFAALTKNTGKPLFISEIGWHQINGTQTANPINAGWFNRVYKELISYQTQGAVGGAYFEYSDEPLKADPGQQTMGAVKFVAAPASDDGKIDLLCYSSLILQNTVGTPSQILTETIPYFPSATITNDFPSTNITNSVPIIPDSTNTTDSLSGSSSSNKETQSEAEVDNSSSSSLVYSNTNNPLPSDTDLHTNSPQVSSSNSTSFQPSTIEEANDARTHKSSFFLLFCLFLVTFLSK